MSEIEKNKNDEIDLIQLFSLIGSKISNLFSGIFKSINNVFFSMLYFGLRNFIAVTIILVISVVLYFLKGNFQEDIFESNMKLKTTMFSQQDVISYINKLKDLAVEENKPVLQEVLEIDSATASKISGIGAYWHIDTDGDGIGDYIDFDEEFFKAPNDSITQRINSHFYVNIEYSEGLNTSLLSEKIISYINKNIFFVQANDIRKRQLKETFILTEAELEKLDSIRLKYNEAIFNNMKFPESRNGQLVFLNGDASKLQEVKLYQNEIFALDEKGQNIVRQLELTPDIVIVIEDFNLSYKPKTKFLSYAKYSILFLILGITGILLFENRKKILELKQQSSLNK